MNNKVLIAITLFLTACNGISQMPEGGMTNYADHLYLDESHAVLENPWKEGSILNSYSLEKTYSHVIVMPNSIARLMVELGIQDCIAGVCESEYIMDSTICAMVADGRIADCGNSMYPNIEKIMALKPDAILVNPFEETGYGQLEKMGIPLIECADYMETSPLGRAEWMRFYGRLFGVAGKADILFRSIEDNYMNLKETASRIVSHPKVMLDTKSGSAWYVAGGKSTISQLICDAAAEYVFKDNEKSGSIPLSFETVFEKAQDSDIWLLKNSTENNLTYKLLESDFKSYSEFLPFKEKNIWVCDVYKVPYFEVTSFHPDILLEEFITIFHPELSSATRFYHPMD